jgi:5-hydroxyisourate hydrolase
MATITSHTLNGTDGTHAGDIAVGLTDLGTGEVVMASATDAGGRISFTIDPAQIDVKTTYELVFDTGPYWAARGVTAGVNQIALRFAMPDPSASYHMPVILNPNAYSMWCSS